MSKYCISQDVERCIGCFSCESHCKMKNDLPPGPRLCQIIAVGPKLINNLPRMANIFVSCFHCETPWCVDACPSGAMQKRPRDGIVFVDQTLCIGCMICITACPWGAPQWNQETGKVVKCDYCMDRIDQGLEPACVSKCITKCLHFGEPSVKTRAPQPAVKAGATRPAVKSKAARSAAKTKAALASVKTRAARPAVKARATKLSVKSRKARESYAGSVAEL